MLALFRFLIDNLEQTRSIPRVTINFHTVLLCEQQCSLKFISKQPREKCERLQVADIFVLIDLKRADNVVAKAETVKITTFPPYIFQDVLHHPDLMRWE